MVTPPPSAQVRAFFELATHQCALHLRSNQSPFQSVLLIGWRRHGSTIAYVLVGYDYGGGLGSMPFGGMVAGVDPKSNDQLTT